MGGSDHSGRHGTVDGGRNKAGGPWRAARRVAGLVAVALAVSSVAAAAQQPAQPGQPANPAASQQGWGVTDTRPDGRAPTVPALKGPQLDGKGAPANTTIIQRPAQELRTGGQVTLVAYVTEDSQPLDKGAIWRIYRDRPGTDGKLRLLSQHREASPVLRLDVGDYLINVAYGRAHFTRKLTVAPGKAVTEKFVLNVGGLKVLAQLASGVSAPDQAISYDILSDDRDQFGSRTTIMSKAKPGVTVRLNAGIYHLVSTYGDANAVVKADVTVEAGKVSEATLIHAGAKVTFKLVNRAGGEALADTQWTVTGAQGETIKESAGALPSHVLAAGTYIVLARRAGQVFRREFSLQAGDAAEVEVIAQ